MLISAKTNKHILSLKRSLSTKKDHKKSFIKISSTYSKQILGTVGKTEKRNASDWKLEAKMTHSEPGVHHYGQR